MYPAPFKYFAPTTIPEAIDLLEEYGEDAKLLAGGHSLLPAMKLRLAQPRQLIDLGRVPGLTGLRVQGDTLVIGALTVHADIASSALVRQRLPGLAEAAAAIGDVQVRNRGTIGGSVAHADPGADLPVILTALGASFIAVSRSGERSISADDFFIDAFTTALEPSEVLTQVRIGLPPVGSGTAYCKLPHPASGYVVVSAGALLVPAADGTCALARVALGGAAGGPHRAATVEAALVRHRLTEDTIANAARRAAEEMEADTDSYASADYKRHLAAVYARRAIATAAQRTGVW